jgi:hypothetical protein
MQIHFVVNFYELLVPVQKNEGVYEFFASIVTQKNNAWMNILRQEKR